MPKLIAIGHTFIDCILMPGGGVHPFVCGGNALYTAAGMNLWTSGVGVVSRIGMDFPAHFLEDVAAAGIDITGVRQLPKPHILVSGFRYFSDGSREFFWPDLEQLHLNEKSHERTDILPAAKDPEGFSEFDPTPDDIPDAYWQAQGFGLGSMGAEPQLAFVKSLSEKGKAITWDSPDPEGNEAIILPWIGKATAFLPSLEEMGWFFNGSSFQDELRRLATWNTPIVGLKLGAEGSMVMDTLSQHIWMIPPLKVTVKDPTGAGDAYCGGFLAGYLETGDPLQAAMMATVSSSVVIEGFDVRHAFHYRRADAIERLERLRPFVKQLA